MSFIFKTEPWKHSVTLGPGDTFKLEGHMADAIKVGHGVTFHSSAEVLDWVASAERREVTYVDLPFLGGIFGGAAPIRREDRYFAPGIKP